MKRTCCNVPMRWNLLPFHEAPPTSTSTAPFPASPERIRYVSPRSKKVRGRSGAAEHATDGEGPLCEHVQSRPRAPWRTGASTPKDGFIASGEQPPRSPVNSRCTSCVTVTPLYISRSTVLPRLALTAIQREMCSLTLACAMGAALRPWRPMSALLVSEWSVSQAVHLSLFAYGSLSMFFCISCEQRAHAK